jgi:hypothetical protein
VGAEFTNLAPTSLKFRLLEIMFCLQVELEQVQIFHLEATRARLWVPESVPTLELGLLLMLRGYLQEPLALHWEWEMALFESLRGLLERLLAVAVVPQVKLWALE